MDFAILDYTNHIVFEDKEIAVAGFEAHDHGRQLKLQTDGTTFVAVGRGQAWANYYQLTAGMYASVPTPVVLSGRMETRVMCVTRKKWRGLFTVGGPVEENGRLQYIDGCTDTGIIAPPKKGDACLNALFFPHKTKQTPHYHPSHRVGMVLDGSGICHHGSYEDHHRTPMRPGDMWIIPAGCWHWFETGAEALRIIAFHPDSEVGPTDETHQMLNATLVGPLDPLAAAKEVERKERKGPYIAMSGPFETPEGWPCKPKRSR